MPASADASFRRYFRLRNGTESFIAMDAPPSQENCLPFVRVAGYLEAMQLNAPRIVEADMEQGFLLLTDLGSEQYLDRLRSDPDAADTLYSAAIDALLKMQRRGEAYQSILPPYDEKLLRFEMSLFHDWLCGTHLNIEFSDDEERAWQVCCDVLVENALGQPQVFVHRDYHSRNLMVMADSNPGILDFQDAVEGPFTYDLVSLLKDCYIHWPAGRVRQWALDYYQNLSDKTRKQVNEPRFMRYFELMGVQRQLKAAGIFCRLNHRDGKSAYLADVPRTLEYIVDVGPRYAELDFVANLIRDRILPAWGNAG
ncbi:MAG: phosphotransferase [Gammaproteobacteria bacterium]|nr:phosphotransferase [Gammaproteobacteria bacterium]